MKTRRSYPVRALVAGLLLLGAGTARGQFVFAHMGADPSTYSTVKELTLRGSIELHDRSMCLTPADTFQVGAMWYTEKQHLAGGFGTIFQFRISDTGNDFGPGVPEDAGADGFAFVIQNYGIGAVGANGGGLGYEGIRNSLAVEFDTWDNGRSGQEFIGDPNGNHVSVHTCGTEPNSAWEKDSLGGTTEIPALADGEVHTVIVEYEPGVLSVFIDDLEAPVLTVEVDLDLALRLEEGTAWVGFTAGTGMAFQNQDMLNWAYTGAEWDGPAMRLALQSGAYPPPLPAPTTRLAMN